MTESVVMDAGPIVSYFDPGDEHHDWAREVFQGLAPPMRSCEAAIVEACYLLRHSPRSQADILGWIERGIVTIDFGLAGDTAAIRRLMQKYRDLPMSLADACLVRMAETFADHAVCTLDGDFRVYRTTDGAALHLVIPDAR